MKILVFLLILGCFIFSYEQPRDYTNLTQGIEPYPDIAIDIKAEYQDDYIKLLWNQKTWKERK